MASQQEVSISTKKIHASIPCYGYVGTSDLSYTKFNGENLIDYSGLRVYKFKKSCFWASQINDAEFYSKVYCWMDNPQQSYASDKRDYIYNKVKELFPSYNVFVAFADRKDPLPFHIFGYKAAAFYCKPESDHKVLIALF